VLLSTYDLGRQPFGLASPAAWLRRAGADVRCNDLSIEPLDEAFIREADCVAFYLPMHTATRLAVERIADVRALNSGARLGFFGLYAPMNERLLRRLGADGVMGGEFEEALVNWAVPSESRRASTHREASSIALDRLALLVPERSGLPELERYAHLHAADGTVRTVGTTEATRGCKHLCRHCPVVPVYGGRFRVVPRPVVLEDIRRQVEAGAEHLTFGDPDFFNGIGHAIPIVQELHRQFPRLSYDVTIKIEHLLRHGEHLSTLRDTGCAFVTSAVESVDDAILERLAKRHTRADFERVAGMFRQEGLVLHPTFVAFTPWTTVRGYQELLASIAELGLIDHVAPIQLGIRLLVPAGSRLLELDELAHLGADFDEHALVHPWCHSQPEVDDLQREIMAIVREGLSRGATRDQIFARAWEACALAPGSERREAPGGARREARAPIPYLTEPWYC